MHKSRRSGPSGSTYDVRLLCTVSVTQVTGQAQVLAGPLIHHAAQAREVLDFYRKLIRDPPDELSVYMNLRNAQPADWVPADLRGEAVVLLIPCLSRDLAEGEALLEPLRRFSPPAGDLVQRKHYLAQQSILDTSAPHHWATTGSRTTCHR